MASDRRKHHSHRIFRRKFAIRTIMNQPNWWCCAIACITIVSMTRFKFIINKSSMIRSEFSISRGSSQRSKSLWLMAHRFGCHSNYKNSKRPDNGVTSISVERHSFHVPHFTYLANKWNRRQWPRRLTHIKFNQMIEKSICSAWMDADGGLCVTCLLFSFFLLIISRVGVTQRPWTP